MEAARQQPPRVLVIDDNHDAADSLALLLRVWGFDVRVCYNGKEGLEAARSYQPDCVLSDIGLPELDGYRLADRFRQDEVLKQTPLIAITAYADVARAKQAGFDEHLLKPADPAALHAILRRLLVMDERLERAEELVAKQSAVISEAVDVMKEVKADVEEIKQGLREVKDDVRSVQEDVKEIKQELQEKE